MTRNEYLKGFEIRDRALTAGLATQPIGWKTFAQLTRFCPASVIDPNGNQIFYRGLRAGFAAEAYVREQDGRFSRLRISCGDACSHRIWARRPYKYVRFASLTPTGAYRISIVLASTLPSAVTIGLKSGDAPVVTLRLAMTRDADGFWSVVPTEVSHHGDWQAKVPESATKTSTQNEAAIKPLEHLAEKGFATFTPLLERIERQVARNQPIESPPPPPEDIIRTINGQPQVPVNIGQPQVPEGVGRTTICGALAAAARVYLSRGVRNVHGLAAIAAGLVILAALCSTVDDIDGSFGPSLPVDMGGPSMGTDPGDVPGDVSDGSADDGAGDGGGGGGGGEARGRGPLPVDLPADPDE